jgi:hypothetical protein
VNQPPDNWERVPLLVRTAVVRELTGWCRNTLYRREAEGVLRAKRTKGGQRRWYKADLAKLLDLPL